MGDQNKDSAPKPEIVGLPMSKGDLKQLDSLIKPKKLDLTALPDPHEKPLSVNEQARDAAAACKSHLEHHYCPGDASDSQINLDQDFNIGGVRGTATMVPGKGGGKIRIPFGRR